MNQRQHGFGLVGAIVLLVIVGIIVAVVVHLGSQLRMVMHYSRSTKCQSNLKSIGTVVTTYKSANRQQTPVMRDRPSFDSDVNVSPNDATGCDEMYGTKHEDGTIEDWSVLGDNAMQNVWLMIGNAVVKHKAFACPGDMAVQRRPTDYRWGWTSPNQYSFSMQWPYAESADGTPNLAPFNAMLENVVIFADRNPGGALSTTRPPTNHPKLGTNVLRADGSVEGFERIDDSHAGWDLDDIYNNAIGIPGGAPRFEYDTSLNISPR
jgi:hypothetical protein